MSILTSVESEHYMSLTRGMYQCLIRWHSDGRFPELRDMHIAGAVVPNPLDDLLMKALGYVDVKAFLATVSNEDVDILRRLPMMDESHAYTLFKVLEARNARP